MDRGEAVEIQTRGGDVGGEGVGVEGKETQEFESVLVIH